MIFVNIHLFIAHFLCSRNIYWALVIYVPGVVPDSAKAVKGETNMTPALVEICDLVCKRGTRLTWKEFRINVKPDRNCFCLSSHELPINRNTIYFTESEDLRLKNFLAGGHHVPGIGFMGDSSYSSPGLLLLS